MRNKYDFTLDHSDSRRDVEKYFYKYGWSNTLKRLEQVIGEIITNDTFELDDEQDCTDCRFERYFSSVQILQEKRFPFRKNIHIVY